MPPTSGRDSPHGIRVFVPQPVRVCCIRTVGINLGDLCQNPDLLHPSVYQFLHEFLSVFVGAEGCTKVSLAIRGDVDPCTLENLLCLCLHMRFDDNPRFLCVDVVAEVWTDLTDCMPSYSQGFQFSCSHCIVCVCNMFRRVLSRLEGFQFA